MTFTNVTRRGLYFACCHREVEPGGSFTVPWFKVRRDRAIRAAMNEKAVAWTSGKDEPTIAGSPRIPAPKVKAMAVDTGAKIREQKAKDDAAVRANMAKSGTYDVPQLKPREVRSRKVVTEKPVTQADIIATGKPKSLADIRRHNVAVHTFSK